MNSTTAPRPLHALAALLVVTFLISACGSGSGGGGLVAPPPDSIDDPLEDPPLPDFSVLNLVAGSEVNNSTTAAYNASATIVNNGDAPGTVSEGWFLISMDPGFDTDYRYIQVRMRPQTATDGAILEPGESRTFALTNQIVDNFIYLVLGRSGTHYAKFWVNPDLSARFINPENSVIPSFAIEETDYSNNLSELITFESITSFPAGDCVPDNYEKNDSLNEATPISFSTTYEFNGCDESLDVMSLDLVAGSSYELYQDPTNNMDRWRLTVVDPQGDYLIRDEKGTSIITATSTGTHHITTSFGIGPLGNDLAYNKTVFFEVRER